MSATAKLHGVRLPLAVQADPAATHGFVTNGFHLGRREPATEVSWGSYIKDRAAAKGRFESLPVSKSNLPFLEFRVAGDLGKHGLSLTLLDLSSGKTTAVRPSQAPGDHWQSCRVRAPHGDFKIIASDGEYRSVRLYTGIPPGRASTRFRLLDSRKRVLVELQGPVLDPRMLLTPSNQVRPGLPGIRPSWGLNPQKSSAYTS